VGDEGNWLSCRILGQAARSRSHASSLRATRQPLGPPNCRAKRIMSAWMCASPPTKHRYSSTPSGPRGRARTLVPRPQTSRRRGSGRAVATPHGAASCTRSVRKHRGRGRSHRSGSPLLVTCSNVLLATWPIFSLSSAERPIRRRRRSVLVQRELDNPPIVLSNSRSGSGRERLEPCLPPAGGLGLGSGTTGGRPFRPVASASPSRG